MSLSAPLRATGRAIWSVVRLLLMAVAVVLFGAGIPLLWVWVGSQLQGGTSPSMAGLGAALLGIVGSYGLLAWAFAWIKDRTSSEAQRPVRYEWNRSLSAERRQGPRSTHTLEDIAVAATIVVAVVCSIWFLLFGSPGTPVTP
jgi:divalent metal cation (Fe/Co/Zn/Cd) transporter